uniref:Ubiquitin carboxyl-terminal hydrolase n=1 Tax=Sphaeramia orbicularis TaxID=375764 RepID=A0A673C650_9TELE
MGKKKGKDKSSKEVDDIDLTGPSCKHIKKGSEQTLIKKLSGNSDWTSCEDCKHDENKEDANSMDPEIENELPTVWMCLKCGHRGCGRNSENKHAVKHYETPRSDPHCLVVSLDTWNVWCYICDDEVQYSRTGHLAQLLTNLKKQTSSDALKKPQKNSEDKENKEEKEKEKDHQKKNTKRENTGKSQKSSQTEDSRVVSVKGLSNLGNTCFFNAVIQNLSQTQLLRQTLNKATEQKMSLNIEPVSPSNLDRIAVQLDQPGSLTLTMCQLLNEIQESKKGVVTPRDLFTQVCKKAARFKGFQQQDSQELLRYLLDGMRAEEIKRVSTGLMDALKESKKALMEKKYEKNGFPKNFVDQVFGGEMTSTIMCQQCKTVCAVEVMLTLQKKKKHAYRKKNQKKATQKASESSQDGRNSPALTNGNDDIPTGAGSKYQQKKAKKQAKKQAKQQRRQQKLDGRVTLDILTSPKNTEDTPTDSAVNADDNADNEPHEEEELNEGGPAQDSLTDGDSSVSNRFTILSEERQGNNSVLEGEQTSNMNQEQEDDSLVKEMEKVNLDDAFIECSDAVDQSMESEDEPLEPKEYTVVNQDPELAFHTLATRTAPEKQECSVQSCLFQFTEVETLTQNNSLLCVTCTKRQPNPNIHHRPKAPTDLNCLIPVDPLILSIHNGYSICKVNRHVQFPMILDLAPFCAIKCKHATEGDDKILYSLYGIVEHSGTMRSGHYTAYVKARPQVPASLSNGVGAEGDAEPPRGSWFHISDTSVQPVSESKVQSCQAYLLFYERIL